MIIKYQSNSLLSSINQNLKRILFLIDIEFSINIIKIEIRIVKIYSRIGTLSVYFSDLSPNGLS